MSGRAHISRIGSDDNTVPRSTENVCWYGRAGNRKCSYTTNKNDKSIVDEISNQARGTGLKWLPGP